MKVTACSMPARSVTALFVAAVLVAAGVTTHAQNRQRPPEPDGTTVGRIGSGEQPTFRAGVTLVTTDVIVRDRSGLFVPDLTREDFRVFEDAVEQVLASGYRTPDIAQPECHLVGCKEMGSLVREKLGE